MPEGVNGRALDVPESFAGFVRPDGRVGVRNHVLVLPTSELVNRAVTLARASAPGVVGVTHHNASEGGPRDFHARVLAGVCTNPNVGAVILVGVGDDEDIAADVAAAVGDRVPLEVVSLLATGGVIPLAAAVADRAGRLLDHLASARREEVPLSHLVVGTECGGSDAYSGLTANPALGNAMDRLVAQGGTALLCELPELIGAEHLVASRAVDTKVADDLVRAVRAWERLVMDMGEDLRGAQPSPGNQEGGLTTIEEKSLGAVSKGGTSPLVEVVGYGEAPSRHGLVVMDTPGHDVEQLTAMAAGGAQVVVFTTGRGTPTASPVSPTIKVSTNTDLARRLDDHIDLDAGVIVEGTPTDEVGAVILREIAAVASGKPTKAERFGQHDFALPRTAPSWEPA